MTHSVLTYSFQFQRLKIEIKSHLHYPNRIQRFVNDECNATFIFECDDLFSGPTICRLLYVGNLPSHVTEASIKEAFPDALQVIIPYDEESMERTG